MFVQDGLERHASERPDKVALVCCGRRLTYSEINRMADRLASALKSRGLKRGDRVVIFLPNSIEAVVGIYAILKAGGVFVPINYSTKFDKLSYIVENCQAAGLLTDARAAAQGTVSKLAAAHPQLRIAVIAGGSSANADGIGISFDAIQETFAPTRPARHCIDLDLACLVYTSGSTGEPKGVMCDHGNVVFAAASIISYLENTEKDVVIGVLPLSFDYGLYQLLMTFFFGGTLVLESTFAFPAAILRLVGEERVTGLPGVPTIFAALLQMRLSEFNLSSLRYITNTAAALPASHIAQLRAAFPGVKVYSMYGLTETKRTLYLPPEQLDARPGSVGIAIPGTEVWLEDAEGGKLGPNSVGELVVRGRHVMRGYWGATAATEERFPPGPLPGERVCRTGDLFRMDSEGYMYFVGRKDDIIKTRGEKVSPKEVENVLHDMDGVFEAAVVGMPDSILGQAIKAVLVADTSRVTKAAVMAHCRARLEDFMVPKAIEFRDELPKTSSGKVLKRGLA
ncbi:MAG TPA: AMP-binding protein [Bryobacteraceae bacterium]|nr:AMP-binding protein [Bryobacteraceae bacterium]